MPQPSIVQAKILAGLFADDGTIKVSSSPEGFNSPTVLALIRSGWILPTSGTGSWPNGSPYRVHVLGRDGVDALQKFLSLAVQKMESAKADAKAG